MFIQTDYEQATHFKIIDPALRITQLKNLDDVNAIIKIEKKQGGLFFFKGTDGILYTFWESWQFTFYKIVDVDSILEATKF